MAISAHLSADPSACRSASVGLGAFDAMFDPFWQDGPGAVAIGRLVDARVCQLRQLRRARGRFEAGIGEGKPVVDARD